MPVSPEVHGHVRPSIVAAQAANTTYRCPTCGAACYVTHTGGQHCYRHGWVNRG